MSGRTDSIAARIPDDLRADLERLAGRDVLERKPDGTPSLTPHIRRALRRYVDAELNGTAATGGLFAPAEGASHRGDPGTSRQAGRDTAPRTGTARFRVLDRIIAKGIRGATADELLEYEERAGYQPAGNGPARRVSELKAAGAIQAKRVEVTSASLVDGTHGDPVTRKTRNGSDAVVYIATDKGRAWHRKARA